MIARPCGRCARRASTRRCAEPEEWVAKSAACAAAGSAAGDAQFETFEYAAQGLRDPFSDASGDTGGPRPIARRKQTLERSLAADMVGRSVPVELVGLVTAPDKVFACAWRTWAKRRSGDRAEDRIELVELVPDGAAMAGTTGHDCARIND